VAFQNPSDDQSISRSVYLRTVLLIIGWAIAGFLLYALSTFLPIAVMGVILLVAWAIVIFDSRKTKSLSSVLCLITCSLTGVCALAMHFTHWHEDVMTRLIFVGLCLGAGLILLDRRADGWSP
jgi:predicted PurR-regulated permease PerM